ncbi:Uncharacterized protein BP5553_02198 [Venustampulla echinocandica]|uniref:DUF221-domain-containing protein n=1 Tax=Venustampulla echinocandica TaxID=2656787 RepID=A0A370U361_9HELO|nr:Uncharacterized protein BP5553_02198 [Venustampulla echinocandica]RDL42219.1 Uncharacterized protein BP5553_02198 [Venustampulla echinocandica]
MDALGSMGNTLARRAEEQSPTDKLLKLLENPFQAQLAQRSVIAGLGTSVGFTVLLAIGFSLLRPFNSYVYAPKLKIADDKHAPPPVGKGVFAWVGPILKTKEQDLLPLIGLDATVFLRILRMCRNMFLAIAVVGCGILIPVNLSKGVKFEDQNFISRLTPMNTYDKDNWGMVVCAWLFDIIVALFLWWNYRAVLRLRRQYYDSPEYQTSLHARTLMISDMPKNLRSDEGIGRLIDEVVPTSSFSRTAVARNVKELPELIEEHNQTVRKLEKYLARYLKDPNNLPAKRPECKPSKKDPSYGSYPRGQKLDAIEYLTGRIKELEIEIKEARLTVDNRNPLPYGFATYEAIEEAHSIAFASKKKHPQGTTIVLAPRPNDIIWKNLPLSPAQRRRRRMVNNLWVILLTLLWVAPNAMISVFLISLSNLGQLWDAFQRSLAAHTTWWSIVQGVASPAITSLVYLVLPIIFRRLAIRAGDKTKTGRERHVAAKLYTFFVFNFLLIFSIFSTAWTFVYTIIVKTNNREDAWKAIQEAQFGKGLFTSLCNISPFWITWLLQRNLGAAVDLAQLWTLVWSFCVRKFSSPTPREIIELTAPQAFDYASYYNYFLFYSTVTLCYGTIQPLALPACAIYFALDVYLKKYLLLYIFITKIESGGMFWRMFYNRMVFATVLANLVVFLSVWVQGNNSHLQAYCVAPLPVLMIAFKVYCKRTFDDKIHYYTTRNMLKDPEASPSKHFNDKKDRFSTRFGHPALYRPLITPMVHASAQNKLAGVYGGRLTDSNAPGSGESASVSGYSDTYAMDAMQDGRPGRKAQGIPGFEMVPENRLDFAYYKGRSEFADEHGGSGGIYGKAEDIIRSDTPASSLGFGSDSRPGTPVGGMTGRRNFSNYPPMPSPYDGQGDIGASYAGGNPRFYTQPNDSQSGLVQSAADMPMVTPGAYHDPRDASQERRAPGFLGGGPQGYGGLPQHPIDEPDTDPTSYDYFRARRNNGGGQPGQGF